MDNLELPFKLMLEASDLIGLQTALRTRQRTFKGLLKGRLRPSAVDAEQSAQFFELKASARRCMRTQKGLHQLMERFFAGPKNLDDVDPDRMKQEREEIQRFKRDLIQVIGNFDTFVLTTGRKIKKRKP
jgi:hypothetical protein